MRKGFEERLQKLQKSNSLISDHLEKNIPKNRMEEVEESTKQLTNEIKEKLPFELDENQEAILKLKIVRYLQNNKVEDLDINTLIDALGGTPKFLSKEKGSLQKLFEIHKNKILEKIAKNRKITQIKASFHSLLDIKPGKIDEDILKLFEEYEEDDLDKKLKIFKKLREYFKDEKKFQEDKKATFTEIEKKYNIEIIPKLDLYENLFETESGNYHLSVLRSKKHLEEESEQMGHCVGTSDSYINKINKGEIEILSFRNKEGEPIITIEYNLKNGNIEQIKKESDEYLDFNDPYYKEFIESLQKMQETSVYDYDYDTGELIEKKKEKLIKLMLQSLII